MKGRESSSDWNQVDPIVKAKEKSKEWYNNDRFEQILVRTLFTAGILLITFGLGMLLAISDILIHKILGLTTFVICLPLIFVSWVVYPVIAENGVEKDRKLECPFCGSEVSANMVFCPQCGREVKDNSPHCGELIRIGSQQCIHCNTSLKPTEAEH